MTHNIHILWQPHCKTKAETDVTFKDEASSNILLSICLHTIYFFLSLVLDLMQFWELISDEHGISPDGHYTGKTPNQLDRLNVYFNETVGKWCCLLPRQIIGQVKSSTITYIIYCILSISPVVRWLNFSGFYPQVIGIYFSLFYADGRYIPRAACLDLEPGSIDSLRTSKYGRLFSPDNCICGELKKTEAKGNYLWELAILL